MAARNSRRRTTTNATARAPKPVPNAADEVVSEVDPNAAEEDEFKKIADIAKNLLIERFGDDFVFHPIWVERKVDHDDDEYLELNIVFDGDQNKLDPDWTVSLGRRMRPALRAIGVEDIPDHAFHEKSEWQEARET